MPWAWPRRSRTAVVASSATAAPATVQALWTAAATNPRSSTQSAHNAGYRVISSTAARSANPRTRPRSLPRACSTTLRPRRHPKLWSSPPNIEPTNRSASLYQALHRQRPTLGHLNDGTVCNAQLAALLGSSRATLQFNGQHPGPSMLDSTMWCSWPRVGLAWIVAPRCWHRIDWAYRPYFVACGPWPGLCGSPMMCRLHWEQQTLHLPAVFLGVHAEPLAQGDHRSNYVNRPGLRRAVAPCDLPSRMAEPARPQRLFRAHLGIPNVASISVRW